jgi:hypothetical protein
MDYRIGNLHRFPEKLPASQRVQAGDRSIKDDQIRFMRQRREE